MTNRTKNIIIGIVALIALLSISYFSCEAGKKSITKHTGIDTTVTIYKTDTVLKPVPYKVTEYVKGKDGKVVTIYRTDTLETVEVQLQPTDTAGIIRRFLDTAFYAYQSDTGRAKVEIMDTVTGNRIVGKGVRITVSDSMIRATTILKPPKPFVLSFTTSLLGNAKQPLFGQGVGLDFKLPNEDSYTLQVFNVKDQPLMWQATKKWPIRLRR